MHDFHPGVLHVQYTTIDHATSPHRSCRPRSVVVKGGHTRALKVLPIHPNQQYHFGIFWKFQSSPLSFGCRSSLHFIWGAKLDLTDNFKLTCVIHLLDDFHWHTTFLALITRSQHPDFYILGTQFVSHYRKQMVSSSLTWTLSPPFIPLNSL